MAAPEEIPEGPANPWNSAIPANQKPRKESSAKIIEFLIHFEAVAPTEMPPMNSALVPAVL